MAELWDASCSNRYEVDNRFTFDLVGRWHKGGRLVIRYDGVVIERIKLATAAWAVLAMLALRNIAMAGLDPDRTFMSPEEIVRRLHQKTPREFVGRKNVVRYVYDLRKVLTESKAACLDCSPNEPPLAWGHRLIESDRRLGYRVNVPPEAFHVHDLDEPPEGDDPACMV